MLIGHGSETVEVDTTRRVEVQGVPFRPLTLSGFLDWLDHAVAARGGSYVCAVNASCVVQASRNAAFMDALRESDVNLPDGSPVAWAVSRLAHVHQARMAGPDTMLDVLRRAEERGYRVLFYGSTEETLERLRHRMQAAYPRVKLVGCISPPFRALSATEHEATCGHVRQLRPDVVLVGLGAPKQEIWMRAHRKELGAVLIGVGAAFDFHAGVLRRAHPLVQRVGLEWAHRLMQEPGRLWKRYLTTLPTFMWRLAMQVVSVQAGAERE